MDVLKSKRIKVIHSKSVWYDAISNGLQCCGLIEMYQLRRSSRFLIAPDDVTKWKHFPRYWPYVRGIHRSPANSPHKGQWRGALVFSLFRALVKGWANYHKASDLRRHRGHYDVIVMCFGDYTVTARYLNQGENPDTVDVKIQFVLQCLLGID